MTLTKTDLTAAQSARKAELETIIETGVKTFLEIGDALCEVRESGLYLDEYDSFGDYCRDKWGMTKQRGYQLIDAAGIAKHVATVVAIPSESAARPLTKLNPRQQVSAAKLLKKANVITATTAARAVEQVQARGGLAAQMRESSRSSEIIDVESTDIEPNLTPKSKAEVVRTIQEWYGKEKNRLNEYPVSPPSRIVELIVRLFQ